MRKIAAGGPEPEENRIASVKLSRIVAWPMAVIGQTARLMFRNSAKLLVDHSRPASDGTRMP